MKKMSNLRWFAVGIIFLFAMGGISNSTADPKSQQGLSMTMVLPWEPSGLDPHTAYEAAVQIINYQVVEPLVTYDYSGPGPDYPLTRRLALNLEWNEDRTVMTFPLRENVKFHDGTDFNADAVVWNFNRIKNLSESLLSPFQYVLYVDPNYYVDNGVTDISWADLNVPIAIINETVATDEFEVEIRLNFPYPMEPLMTSLPMISPTAHAEDFDVAFTISRDELVGTGPFKWVSWDVTEKRASFTRNDEYWRTPAAISHLYFDFFDTATEAVAALQSGDVDYFPNPPGESLSILEADANINVVQGPSMINYNFMPMNTQNLSTEMRQALNYGINMSYVKEEFMGGIAGERCGILPEGAEYYNPDYAVPDYDLAMARQILIDDGLAGSLTATSTDQEWQTLAETAPIEDLIYTYYFAEDFGSWQDVGLWLNFSVNKLGMTVSLNPVGDGEIWNYFWDETYRDTTHLMQPTGWGWETRDGLLQIPWLFLSTSGYNYAGWNNTEFDDLYIDAITATTVEEKQTIMNRMQEIVNIDDPPFLWTYPPQSYAATRTGWEGARVGFFYGDIHCYYMNQGDWEAPEEEELGREFRIPGFVLSALTLLSILSISVILVSVTKRRK
jgi:peptide/nickel transport system substrate-binding protein